MDFARRAVTVPAYPEVQGELGSDLPVVLNEPAVVVIVVVAISVGFRSRRRVNRGFLKIGIVIGKVAVRGRRGQICDRPIRLQRAITGWSERRKQFGKLVVSGCAQVPIAIENSVLRAAAELD